MSFIPDTSTLLTYTIACFVLFATPGPDMSLFLAKTVQGGRRSGVASLSGATAGCLVHSLAAAFGLSALIAASAAAFTVLKVVGAVYLLWMAYQAIRHGSALRSRVNRQARGAVLDNLHARARHESHQPEGGAVLSDISAAVRIRR